METGSPSPTRRTSLIGTLAFVLLPFFFPLAGWAEPSPLHRLKLFLDPFHKGPDLSLGFLSRQNRYRDLQFLQFGADYGFDTGITLSAFLPVITRDTRPAAVGAQSPRLGGGHLARFELTADFRLWGDALDYFAFEFAAGFPWQTDKALRQSVANSWVFPISIFGRWDHLGWATEARLTDQINTPAHDQAGSADAYFDTNNQINASLLFLFYPLTWLSPSVGYSFQSVTHEDRGTNNGANTFVVRTYSNALTHYFSFNLDMAPIRKPLVLSLGANYYLVSNPSDQARWQWAGKVKWLF